VHVILLLNLFFCCRVLLLPCSLNFLQIILANTGDPQASHLASKLSETGLKVQYHQFYMVLEHLAGPPQKKHVLTFGTSCTLFLNFSSSCTVPNVLLDSCVSPFVTTYVKLNFYPYFQIFITEGCH
jgi:hypothetical protein